MMYAITIYFQGQRKNERYHDTKWQAQNWRQAAAIALKKAGPYIRANINRIQVHGGPYADSGERVYRSENPYDYPPVYIISGKRVSRRITDRIIFYKNTCEENRKKLIEKIRDKQAAFEKFIMTQPYGRFFDPGAYKAMLKTFKEINKNESRQKV